MIKDNDEYIPIYKRAGCNHYVLGECSREFGTEFGNCLGTLRCIDNLIETIYKYKEAFKRIKFEVFEELKDLESDTNVYGCLMEILNIINKTGVQI